MWKSTEKEHCGGTVKQQSLTESKATLDRAYIMQSVFAHALAVRFISLKTAISPKKEPGGLVR